MSYSRTYYLKLRAERKCLRCRGAAGDRSMCPTCLALNTAAAAQRRIDRKAKGCCPDCGFEMPKNCATVLCDSCLDARLTQAEIRRAA